MNPVNKIADFIIQNFQTVVLVYAAIGGIMAIIVNVFFWKISFEVDKEYKDDMRSCDYYDPDEMFIGKWVTRAVGLIISVPLALLWWGVPILLIALFVYDTIEQKHPELFAHKADEEFDKEEENK